MDKCCYGHAFDPCDHKACVYLLYLSICRDSYIFVAVIPAALLRLTHTAAVMATPLPLHYRASLLPFPVLLFVPYISATASACQLPLPFLTPKCKTQTDEKNAPNEPVGKETNARGTSSTEFPFCNLRFNQGLQGIMGD